uniref:Cytochrome c oxidase subunit 3 n=1 Tax=Quercus lobata TaxID=97700 RepID=A0A7N2N845_QUELO
MGSFSNSIQGIEGAIALGLGHGFVSSGLFICVGGVLYDRSHTRLITYYRGIAQIMPLFSVLFFILCLGNAVLLLASGVTITYSHHSLIQGNRNGALLGAIFTVFLAMIFTAFQGVEYAVSSFSFTDYNFTTAYAEQVEYNT